MGLFVEGPGEKFRVSGARIRAFFFASEEALDYETSANSNKRSLKPAQSITEEPLKSWTKTKNEHLKTLQNPVEPWRPLIYIK